MNKVYTCLRDDTQLVEQVGFELVGLIKCKGVMDSDTCVGDGVKCSG